MQSKIFIKGVFILLLITTISAQVTYDSCEIYGTCKPITSSSSVNYSLVNVNNSQYLQGLTPSQVANLYSESDPIFSSNLTNGFSQDVNPLTNIIQSLGTSIKRWLKLWVQDVDISNNLNVTNNITSNYYLCRESTVNLNVNHSVQCNSTGTYIIG